MNVLGIETTCDETSASVVQDGKKILSLVTSSQIETHRPFGGVYPELASRQHFDLLLPVIDKALKEANCTKNDIDLIAIAHAPGLIGALVMGLNTAKALALAWDIPFVGVNHVEAHLYAALMTNPECFPSIGLVLSGGHTFLVKMEGIQKYTLIGTTVDDAIGEAFDKVANMMGLPYPGGPEIEKLATKGDPKKYPFKAGKVKTSTWNFSFSGLKTNVLYTLKGEKANRHSPLTLSDDELANVAASFQHTATSDVVTRSQKALREFGGEALYVGGGVSSNQYLRNLFTQANIPALYPPKELCLDNAAMIAGLGFHVYANKKSSDPWDLSASPRASLTS